ncbi:hypothetical protein R5W23_006228 [Gemmata sp. JC673]|uniref:Uncharacterized protein n=1 Tax=Gemmata algarum TaxID=2975278 RepID=A0ABU5EUR0_9BACT|nr:hypothetical protein [Gemmata algarum]MDY3559038.1 hypothetical protein [Gemmata algarum]
MSASYAPPPRGFGTSAWGVALHAALLFGLFVLYVIYVPPAAQVFDRYALTLPKATRFVVSLSALVADYWWALGLAAGAALAADFAAIWALRRTGAAQAVVLIATVALLLVAYGALTVYAVEYPKEKLREGLSR